MSSTDNGKSCNNHVACRSTQRPDDLKKNLDSRLARVEGQIRALRRMIADDVYCDDILIQGAAAKSALGKVSLLLLDHHLKHCLIDQVRSGNDDIVDELLLTLGRMV